MRIVKNWVLVFLVLFGSILVLPNLIQNLNLNSPKVLFLEGEMARRAIISDTMEHFFESISRLDMCIQLKEKCAEEKSLASIKDKYLEQLQQEILTFTEAEKATLKRVFRRALYYCLQINKNVLPEKIFLIKSISKGFGPQAYYTRQNCIVIPEAQLLNLDEDLLFEVMVHELFHIYSRFNPQKRKDLYAQIGFNKLISRDRLHFPDSLKRQLLLNPDGVTVFSMTMALSNGDSVEIIPLIVSKVSDFQSSKRDYFNYLELQLYPITYLLGNQKYQVSAIPVPKSEWQDFYSKIGDNTAYIIHPDEILAENFKILIKKQALGKAFNEAPTSKAGEELLEKIRLIIQE